MVCHKYIYFSFNPYSKFISLPASHLCHQGHGRPCSIVRSFIYQLSIMTLRQEIYFIRVNIHPWSGEGLTADFKTHLFYQDHNNISRCQYLPCKSYCLLFACIKAIIYIGTLSSCPDIASIREQLCKFPDFSQ
jgi:hypothetical protein